MRSALSIAARVVTFAIILVATFAFVRWWDFTLPSFGQQRYQAVFLSNGQTFFGRYYDRLGPYVKLDFPYYIQQTGNPNDKNNPVQQKIVRRGNELHAPEPEMLIPKTSILFVEDLSPGSPVVKFMEAQGK